MLSRTTCNAHASLTSIVAGPVTNQDSAPPHLFDEPGRVRLRRSDAREYKVRMAAPELKSALAQSRFHACTRLVNLVNILPNVSLIPNGLRQTRKGNGIHVVGRAGAPQRAHLLSIADQQANAQTRETISFGESTGHENVGRILATIEHRFPIELKVRFIYQECRF